MPQEIIRIMERRRLQCKGNEGNHFLGFIRINNLEIFLSAKIFDKLTMRKFQIFGLYIYYLHHTKPSRVAIRELL